MTTNKMTTKELYKTILENAENNNTVVIGEIGRIKWSKLDEMIETYIDARTDWLLMKGITIEEHIRYKEIYKLMRQSFKTAIF